MDVGIVVWIMMSVAAGFAVVAAALFGAAYWRHRGSRRLTCPLTERDAVVSIAAGRTALRAMFGSPDVAVRGCSLWDDNLGCPQLCAPRLACAPRVDPGRLGAAVGAVPMPRVPGNAAGAWRPSRQR
jgi:hypothetical protein